MSAGAGASGDNQACAVSAEVGRGRPGWPPRAAQLCRQGVLRLPGGQQWALRRIEALLLADDLRLDSQFALFARLADGEAMPLTERVPVWPWRLDLAVMTGALVMAGSALTLCWLASGLRTYPAGAAQAGGRHATVRASPAILQLHPAVSSVTG